MHEEAEDSPHQGCEDPNTYVKQVVQAVSQQGYINP